MMNKQLGDASIPTIHRHILKATPAPLWRMVCSMVYDSFLMIACLLVVMFIIVAINGFQPISNHAWKKHLTTGILMTIWAAFFVYFWSQQGQTLGMRAWKLVLIAEDGRPPHPARALWRWCLIMLIFLLPISLCFTFDLLLFPKDWLIALIILTFPVILGYSFALFGKSKRSLFDRLSRTSIVVVDKNPYQK